MAKVQRTFMLPAELSAVIDHVIERGGTSLSKIVNAALLQYFLDYCNRPEDAGPLVCPANEWMTWASRLDRPKASLGDLPLGVLKDAVYIQRELVKNAKERGDKAELKRREEVLAKREEALAEWTARCEQAGGAMPAILRMIDEFYRIANVPDVDEDDIPDIDDDDDAE